MEHKVKTCPLCGSKNLSMITREKRGNVYHILQCKQCGCSVTASDEIAAIDKWNSRKKAMEAGAFTFHESEQHV